MRSVFSIILIAAAVGLFVGYTEGAYNLALSSKAEVANYSVAFADSKQYVTIRQSLLDKYNTVSSDSQARLGKLLPDSVDNIRLILEVATIGARYGMVPKEVSFSGGSSVPGSSADINSNATTVAAAIANSTTASALTGAGPVGTISMTFTVSGSYQSFQSLLNDLSQSLRLIDVTGINFSVGPNDFSDYQVTITAYWLTPSAS